jgi:hypothetical protein
VKISKKNYSDTFVTLEKDDITFFRNVRKFPSIDTVSDRAGGRKEGKEKKQAR